MMIMCIIMMIIYDADVDDLTSGEQAAGAC